jgi:hypothetical protein
LEHDEEREPIARPQELLRVRELLHTLAQDRLRGALQLLLRELLELLASLPGRVPLRQPGRCAGLDE